MNHEDVCRNISHVLTLGWLILEDIGSYTGVFLRWVVLIANVHFMWFVLPRYVPSWRTPKSHLDSFGLSLWALGMLYFWIKHGAEVDAWWTCSVSSMYPQLRMDEPGASPSDLTDVSRDARCRPSGFQGGKRRWFGNKKLPMKLQGWQELNRT